MKPKPWVGSSAVVFFMTTIAAIFLGRVVAPDAALYRSWLTDNALQGVSYGIAIVTLTFGARQAFVAAQRAGEGNPARLPWQLFSLWFALSCVGQIAFSVYQSVLRIPIPFPSPGDFFVLSGYMVMIAGLVLFRRAFVRTGLAVGNPSYLTVLAVALALTTAVVAALIPSITVPQALMQRLVNVAYPAFDVGVLTALFVVFETLRPLQGGRVFVVWMSLALSLLLACVGDVLFAYFSIHGFGRFEALVNLTYMMSNAAGAHGAWAQRRLLERKP
jgi:hypothetical protein